MPSISYICFLASSVWFVVLSSKYDRSYCITGPIVRKTEIADFHRKSIRIERIRSNVPAEACPFASKAPVLFPGWFSTHTQATSFHIIAIQSKRKPISSNHWHRLSYIFIYCVFSALSLRSSFPLMIRASHFPTSISSCFFLSLWKIPLSAWSSPLCLLPPYLLFLLFHSRLAHCLFYHLLCFHLHRHSGRLTLPFPFFSTATCNVTFALS